MDTLEDERKTETFESIDYRTKLLQVEMEMEILDDATFKLTDYLHVNGEERVRLRNTLDQNISKEIAKDVVVEFVKAIEKANQYFNLKGHLRKSDVVKYGNPKTAQYFNLEGLLRKSDVVEYDNPKTADEIVDNLITEQDGDDRFNKLNKEDFARAVHARISEVYYGHCDIKAINNMRRTKEFNDAVWFLTYSCPRPNKCKPRSMYSELRSQTPELQFHDWDTYFHPIFNLVFEVREKGNVMHPNAEVELERLKKSYRFVNHVSQIVYEPVGIFGRNPDYRPPPPATGNAVDAMYVEALDKYRELIKFVKAEGMWEKKRQRAFSNMSDRARLIRLCDTSL